MKTRLYIIAAVVLAAAIGGRLAQAAPSLMTYQGRLTDSKGAGVSGMYTIDVRIYDAQTGEREAVWGPQTFKDVTLTDGYFDVVLGPQDDKGRPLPVAFQKKGERFLGIALKGSQEFTERARIPAVPYAMNSSDSVPVGTVLSYAGHGDPPEGFLWCDGQFYDRAKYQALFDVVGMQYSNVDYEALLAAKADYDTKDAEAEFALDKANISQSPADKTDYLKKDEKAKEAKKAMDAKLAKFVEVMQPYFADLTAETAFQLAEKFQVKALFAVPDVNKRFILGGVQRADIPPAGGASSFTLAVKHLPDHTHRVRSKMRTLEEHQQGAREQYTLSETTVGTHGGGKTDACHGCQAKPVELLPPYVEVGYIIKY